MKGVPVFAGPRNVVFAKVEMASMVFLGVVVLIL